MLSRNRINLIGRFMEFHGITISELAEYMPGAKRCDRHDRYKYAWRYMRGHTEWTLPTIRAALRCCSHHLNRPVTFEEAFDGAGLPKSLRRAA